MQTAPQVRFPRFLFFFRCLAMAFVVLAPLKFSSVVMSGEESGLLSADWALMLFNYWPVFLVPVCSGGLLLLALALFPLPAWGRSWWFPGVWLGLLAGFLPGLLATTELDVARNQLFHFLGMAALALALFLWVSRDRLAKPCLFFALALAGLLVASLAWEQRPGGGLDRFEIEAKSLHLRQFFVRAGDQEWGTCRKSLEAYWLQEGKDATAAAAEAEKDVVALRTAAAGLQAAAPQAGLQLPPEVLATADRYGRHLYVQTGMEEGILKRIQQRRAYGTFGYPNAYAACLLLLGPILILGFWRLGANFEPRRVSSPLLAGLGLVLWAGALGFSESRSAILALGLGVGLAGMAALKPNTRSKEPRTSGLAGAWMLGIGLGAAVLAILLVVLLSKIGGRKILGTLWSRLDYWKVAVRVFWEHPWAGVGWGEFYPWYQRLKLPEAEMVRTPHSFVLKFASQAGIAGLAAALAFLSLPFQMAWGRFAARCRDLPLALAVTIGFGAWTLHSLTDFNFLGSGLMVVAVAVCMLPLSPDPEAPAADRGGGLLVAMLLAAGLGVAAVSNLRLVPAQLALQELERNDLDLAQRQSLVRKVADVRPWYMEPWQKLCWKCWEEDSAFHSDAARQAGLEAARTMARLTPHRSGILAYAAHIQATVAPRYGSPVQQLEEAERLAVATKLWAGSDRQCLEQADAVLALCAKNRQSSPPPPAAEEIKNEE